MTGELVYVNWMYPAYANRHIYAQLIDDSAGKTLASPSFIITRAQIQGDTVTAAELIPIEEVLVGSNQILKPVVGGES